MTGELPAWIQAAWWYDAESDDSPLVQALAWACAGRIERMDYWTCAKLRAGLASEDGLIPGVRWNAPGFQGAIYHSERHPATHDIPLAGFPLSVNRFLSALRTLYNIVPAWGKEPKGSIREQAYTSAKLELISLAEALGLRQPQQKAS